MRLEKCYFCSATCWPGHGMTFVRNDCKIFRFCRAKCNKLFKKKKNPRKTKWTKASRAARGKDLTNDPALAFEKKRDEPEKYSREKWQQAIDSMKEIVTIKNKRNAEHIKKRLQKGKEHRKGQDRLMVKRNMSMIRSPAANTPIVIETEKKQVAKAVVERTLRSSARLKKTKKTRTEEPMSFNAAQQEGIMEEN